MRKTYEKLTTYKQIKNNTFWKFTSNELKWVKTSEVRIWSNLSKKPLMSGGIVGMYTFFGKF